MQSKVKAWSLKLLLLLLLLMLLLFRSCCCWRPQKPRQNEPPRAPRGPRTTRTNSKHNSDTTKFKTCCGCASLQSWHPDSKFSGRVCMCVCVRVRVCDGSWSPGIVVACYGGSFYNSVTTTFRVFPHFSAQSMSFWSWICWENNLVVFYFSKSARFKWKIFIDGQTSETYR